MSSISGLGTSATALGSQTSSISVPTDDGLAIARTTETFNLASNSNYLFSKLNQSILNSSNVNGVQGDIDTYTQSLPASNLYASSYTAPSAKFLQDLQAIKSDAKAGNLEAAVSDLQHAKYDSPDNIGEGIIAANAKHDVSGAAALYMEGAANTEESLVSQGYTASNATARAIALTINSVVDHSQNTAATAKTQAAQITDLATSLASSTLSTNKQVVPTSGNELFDVMSSMLTSTASATSPGLAYGFNNQELAAMDSMYGSNGTAISSADVVSNVNKSTYV